MNEPTYTQMEKRVQSFYRAVFVCSLLILAVSVLTCNFFGGR